MKLCTLITPALLVIALLAESAESFGVGIWRSSLVSSSRSLTFSFAAASDGTPDDPNDDSSTSINEQPKQEERAPPPPQPRVPPPVPQKRLDPLMASLTRMDPATQNAPTTNVPLLGEIPIDGSLVVLAPAAIIAVLGFVLSIIIGIQSQDLIVESVERVSQEVVTSANTQANQVYDPNECRGLCSSQDEDLERMRSFMSSFGKK